MPVRPEPWFQEHIQSDHKYADVRPSAALVRLFRSNGMTRSAQNRLVALDPSFSLNPSLTRGLSHEPTTLGAGVLIYQIIRNNRRTSFARARKRLVRAACISEDPLPELSAP